MKMLWKNREYELIIVDDNNYDVNRHYITKSKDGEEYEAKANIGHFNKVQHAVKRVCELRANDRCEDLKSWMKEFKASIAYFEKLLG